MKQVIYFCILALLLTGCKNKPQDKPTALATPNIAAGSVASAFNLVGADGSAVSFKPGENPQGIDATLLIFWSLRWDPNSKTLLNRARELQERCGPRGLRIITIAYDGEPAKIRSFLAGFKLPFAVALAANNTLKNYSVKAIPTSILIAKNGKLIDRWEGYFSTQEQSERITPHISGRSGNSGD